MATFWLYQRCCRNETLLNITEPLETGATYTVHISPEKFKEKIQILYLVHFHLSMLFCVNKPYYFKHTATDADGDSLVYSFCTPLKAKQD